MWLETLIKVVIWITLFSFFWDYVNNVFYYFFYSLKVVYSWLLVVFKVLRASDFTIWTLYYVFVFFVIFYLFSMIKKFIS